MATQAPLPWYRTPQFANLLGNVGIGLLVEDDPWAGIGKGLQQAQAQQMQQQMLAQEQARWQAGFDQKERQFGAQLDEAQRDRDFQVRRDDTRFGQQKALAQLENDFALGRIDAQAAKEKALAILRGDLDATNARRTFGYQAALNEQEAQLRQQYPQASGLGFNFDPYVSGNTTYQTRQNRASGAVEYLDPQDNQWKPGMPPGNPMRPQDAALGGINRADVRAFYTPVQEAALAAGENLPKIDRMLDIVRSNPDAYFGPGAEGLNVLQSVGVGLGWLQNDRKVASFEEFAGLAVDQALSGLQQMTGNDTDRDYLRVLQRGGNLANSREGNIAKLEAARRVEQRKEEIGALTDRMVAEGRSLPEIRTAIREYNKANPLFKGLPGYGAASGGALKGTTKSGLSWEVID